MGDTAGGTQGEAKTAGCKRPEGVKDTAGVDIAGEIITPQGESNKQAKQAKASNRGCPKRELVLPGR